jgi:hypothetical protein
VTKLLSLRRSPSDRLQMAEHRSPRHAIALANRLHCEALFSQGNQLQEIDLRLNPSLRVSEPHRGRGEFVCTVTAPTILQKGASAAPFYFFAHGDEKMGPITAPPTFASPAQVGSPRAALALPHYVGHLRLALELPLGE